MTWAFVSSYEVFVCMCSFFTGAVNLFIFAHSHCVCILNSRFLSGGAISSAVLLAFPLNFEENKKQTHVFLDAVQIVVG